MLQWLLTLFTSNSVQTITKELSRAWELKLLAETSEAKLEADMTIAQLEARLSLMVAEQRRWYTAWIRPMIAAPVVLYVWKIIVYDTILQLGVTPYPGDFVHWVVVTVIGAYMLTRPFERK